MEFKQIKFDKGKGLVELAWTEKEGKGTTIDQTMKSSEAPTGAFRDALSAFGPYVCDLIDAPKAWSEKIEIRGVSLSRETDTNLRGLVVTALVPVKKAKNRTLLLNTPYMSEKPETVNNDGAGYLTAETLALVALIEEEAEKFHGGERGEQSSMFPDEREPVSGRKPRGSKAPDDEQPASAKDKPKRRRAGKDFVPGVGDIENPNKTEAPDDDTLRRQLLRIGRDVPIDAIQRWGSRDRTAAQRYADSTIAVNSGEAKEGSQAQEPDCVIADATLPLDADDGSLQRKADAEQRIKERNAAAVGLPGAPGVGMQSTELPASDGSSETGESQRVVKASPQRERNQRANGVAKKTGANKGAGIKTAAKKSGGKKKS